MSGVHPGQVSSKVAGQRGSVPRSNHPSLEKNQGAHHESLKFFGHVKGSGHRDHDWRGPETWRGRRPGGAGDLEGPVATNRRGLTQARGAAAAAVAEPAGLLRLQAAGAGPTARLPGGGRDTCLRFLGEKRKSELGFLEHTDRGVSVFWGTFSYVMFIMFFLFV